MNILNGLLRRLSSWLGILMAAIRYFAIKYPMSPTIDVISRPLFAGKSTFLTLLISALVSFLYWVHFSVQPVFLWKPVEECGFIDNYTVAIYGAELSEFIQEYPSILGICQSADGLSQVIPAVTLPVLTFLLIKQLDITEKNRSNFLKSQKNNENSKTDTTKMIMMMTIASTLAEGPIGVLPIVEIFACPFLMVISANLMVIFGAVVALNTSTHCFVCCAISSQYRKTVTQVFLWENHSRTQKQVSCIGTSMRITPLLV